MKNEIGETRAYLSNETNECYANYEYSNNETNGRQNNGTNDFVNYVSNAYLNNETNECLN